MQHEKMLSTATWLGIALVAGYVSCRALDKWDGKLPPVSCGCGLLPKR